MRTEDAKSFDIKIQSLPVALLKLVARSVAGPHPCSPGMFQVSDKQTIIDRVTHPIPADFRNMGDVVGALDTVQPMTQAQITNILALLPRTAIIEMLLEEWKASNRNDLDDSFKESFKKLNGVLTPEQENQVLSQLTKRQLCLLLRAQSNEN